MKRETGYALHAAGNSAWLAIAVCCWVMLRDTKSLLHEQTYIGMFQHGVTSETGGLHSFWSSTKEMGVHKETNPYWALSMQVLALT